MQKDGEYLLEERETKARKSSPAVLSREQQQQVILLQKQQLQCQTKTTSPLAKDCSDHQQMQPGKGAIREPLSEISVACAERRGRLGTSAASWPQLFSRLPPRRMATLMSGPPACPNSPAQRASQRSSTGSCSKTWIRKTKTTVLPRLKSGATACSHLLPGHRSASDSPLSPTGVPRTPD
uniref:Uncharacterized protein n=1 Tax=Gadus morhua TaxID=8049 RepID=A0A8C5AFT9_GADMO